jgi:hypothetical protein
MDNLQKIIEVLSELRSASLSINPEHYKATIQKYDLLFLGEKFNKINTLELRHSMDKVFNFEISKEELLELIPIACKSLGMKTEAMGLVENPSKLEAYSITLF